MLIDIIDHNSEQRLLTFLASEQRQQAAWNVLFFRCTQLPYLPSAEDLWLTIRPAMEGKSASIYFFYDGDVAIVGPDITQKTLQAVSTCLYDRYAPKVLRLLHHYYDLQTEEGEFTQLCKDKLNLLFGELVYEGKPSSVQAMLPPPTAAQLTVLENAIAARKKRKGLKILIVEDQLFSQKMLFSLLQHLCKIFIAADALTALDIYCAEAPNIVFLDIELPSISGHQFAAMVQSLDPKAYVVMVTGNHYLEDVRRAKSNGARGFIAKPYSKKKIMEQIEKYIHQQKS